MEQGTDLTRDVSEILTSRIVIQMQLLYRASHGSLSYWLGRLEGIIDSKLARRLCAPAKYPDQLACRPAFLRTSGLIYTMFEGS